jgi:peptide/nickel transport system ATP-binding protein
MTILDVRDLSVRYEPKASRPLDAVQNISFSIEPGEFVGLIGESGSGKTTLGTALLRLLERPGRISGGSIEFNGTDITHLPEDDLRSLRWRDLSTVFQSSMNSLNPVVRVEGQFRDAIEQHSTLRGEAVTRRIRELFDMVIIDPKFMTAYPHELSGGMRQRVALARALAQDSSVLLMDEPFAALDAITRDVLHQELTRVWAQQGLSIVFVTHNVREAARLGQRVVLLGSRPGRVVREWEVDIPHPRTIESPGVSALAAEITRELHQEISRHA